jgi:hypothetical protein
MVGCTPWSAATRRPHTVAVARTRNGEVASLVEVATARALAVRGEMLDTAAGTAVDSSPMTTSHRTFGSVRFLFTRSNRAGARLR